MQNDRNPMTSRKRTSQAGYTLLELAIAIVIIGVFLASGAMAYHMYKLEQKNEKTEFKRLRIDFALNDFKKRHGRYPCPARYDIGRENPNYGYETDCADTSIAPGVCKDGLCVEKSIRQVQIGDGSHVYPRVRRGAIPFRVLNLMEKESYDEFGGRFSYAVTELLTNWETFDALSGGIDVVDGQDPSEESMVDPAGSALYFVFSHGPDLVGAYNEAGVMVVPCTGMMFDNQNCNTSPADSNAIYRYTVASDVAINLGGSSSEGEDDEGGGPPPVGVNLNRHYDDYAVYKGVDVKPLWKMSDEPGHENDAHDISLQDQHFSISGGGFAEKLNVGGDMALTGDYLSNEICDMDGNNCFEASDIGGPDGMACPAGQVAYGIGNRALRCRLPSFTCPSGLYVSGFVSGVPKCAAVPVLVYCAASSRTVCGESKSLAQSTDGKVISLTGGASRVQSYRCANQNGTGVWQDAGTSGVCDCTASSETVIGGSASCGSGYTGHTTTTTTTACPSGETTTTTSRTACVCAGSTETRTRTCPSGQSGNIIETRSISCSGNTASVGSWVETSNNCTCTSQNAQTRTQPCPANHSGTINQTRTWDAAACQWNAWQDTSNNCTCAVKTENSEQNCASPLTGKRKMVRTSQCPSGNWGPYTEISNNCTCGTHTEAGPDLPCPAGQVGKITRSRLVDCHGTPMAPWVEVSSCTPPPVCRWSTGSQTGVGSVGPMANSECTCGTPKATCKVSTNMPGSFLLYDCSCN